MYSAGLCDAVNIAPGRSSVPGGEVQQVGRRQAEVDDVDALLQHPAVNASTSSGPDGRMSRATSSSSAPAKRAKATPSGVGDLGVELVGHRAADVVGLDDLIEY